MPQPWDMPLDAVCDERTTHLFDTPHPTPA
jgi:hypothetical protein